MHVTSGRSACDACEPLKQICMQMHTRGRRIHELCHCRHVWLMAVVCPQAARHRRRQGQGQGCEGLHRVCSHPQCHCMRRASDDCCYFGEFPAGRRVCEHSCTTHSFHGWLGGHQAAAPSCVRHCLQSTSGTYASIALELWFCKVISYACRNVNFSFITV